MSNKGLQFAPPPAGLPACGEPVRAAGCAAAIASMTCPGLRLHRHRLRIRRQRDGASPDGKGLSRRRHGDGPPLDARRTFRARTGRSGAGSGGPNSALRGFFNMKPFRHVMILHGCAVGGGSITYANTMLVPRDTIWENGSWAGLADWKAEMPATTQTALRMLGVTENRILGPGGSNPASARPGAIGRGDTFYRTRVAVFEAPGGRSRGRDLSRPLLRRRRAGAQHLHRLRRLHDGLPLQREEHAGQELPLPGREARRARVSRKPAWWMSGR